MLVMIITGEQIRAAMGAMKWSRKDLAERSGVNPRTIQRIAEARGVPNSSAKYLAEIVKAFELGDEFGCVNFFNEDYPGIKFIGLS